MTHVPEREFHEAVEERLSDYYGEENVESEVYLPETRRYVDLIVHGEYSNYAIEVENDWEAVMKGVGQAILYASHFDGYYPMVVIPDDHTESPEIDKLRRHIPIIEIPYEESS